MKCLVFDTETSGLPPKMKTNPDLKKNLNIWPYLMQLTFIIYDTETETVDEIYNKYINIPDEEITKINYEIENKKIEIEEGEKMLKEKNDDNLVKKIQREKKTVSILSENIKRWKLHQTERISLEQVNSDFFSKLDNIDLLVAHNIMFDYQIMLVTAMRDSKNQEQNIIKLTKMKDDQKCFCTMEKGKEICKCLKYPSLTKTYETLFGYIPNESKLHDSLFDVVITLRVFVKIITDKDIYYNKNIKDLKTAEVIKIIKEVEPLEKKGAKYTKKNIKKMTNRKKHNKKSKNNKKSNKIKKYKKRNQ